MAEMNPYEFRQTSGGQGQTAGQAPPYERRAVEKPMAVTVFGLLNIFFGCYFLVRFIPGWYKIISEVFKNTGKITGVGIPNLLLFAVEIGLAVWLIVLGIGLLTMKRWACRVRFSTKH